MATGRKVHSQPVTTIPKEDETVKHGTQQHSCGTHVRDEEKLLQGQHIQNEGSEGDHAEEEDGHMQPVCRTDKSQQELIEMAFAGKAMLDLLAED